MSKKVVQCKLQRGTSTVTAWLPTSKKFKIGDAVTLKGDPSGDLWTVMTMGEERDAAGINNDWRVGGI